MARGMVEIYGNRAAPGDADYPKGTFKDQSGGIPNSGTPLQMDWAKNLDALYQWLMEEGGVEYDGLIDTVPKCQYGDALKRIIAHRFTAVPADTLNDTCAGVPTNQWHSPSAAPNFLDLGYDVIDACMGRDIGGETTKPVMYCLDETTGIRKVDAVWDNKNNPSVGSTVPFQFSATPGRLLSICSDGDSLYALWYRAADDEIFISKFGLALQPVSYAPLWEYQIGQPYRPLTPNGYDIIVANSDRVAIFMNEVQGPSITYRYAVATIRKNGTGYMMGQGNGGNAFSSNDTGELYKIVSDGDHLFWIIRSGGISHLASAYIANPETTNYSLAQINDAGAAHTDFPKGLLALHNVIVMATPSGEFYQFVKQRDEMQSVVSIPDISASTGTASYGFEIGFDGINIWARFDVNTAIGLTTLFAKIPASNFAPISGNTSGFFREVPAPFLFTNVGGAFSSQLAGRFVFDQRDLWFFQASGKIFRITNPGMR